MKAIVKAKAEPGLWMEEVEKPSPGSREILIKIKTTAICGTDLHIYKWDEWAQKTVPVPCTIGHEFMGEIVELGEDVQGFSVGDRVSGEGHLVCGYCRNCRAGKRHLCRNTQGIGYDTTGAFSEYFVMTADNVIRLPDDVTDEVAAILDPFGNAVHSSLHFDLVGEDVLITGAGPVGIMSAAIARHVGARYVVITDVNESRLKLAKKVGIDRAVNPANTDLKDVMKDLGMTEGFDVGLEMSGNEVAFKSMLDVMNYGGKISYLGIPPNDFAINWHQVVFKSLTIAGIYGRRMFETWYKGLAMLQGGLNISPVITDHYPVDDFEEAFQRMVSGESGKIVLEWE
ncbi:MAG: L-threonine 3-dehydrogenase [Coxiellaceae bacterium]|nr:L-threonine 3-dehydrogenase [Coxiellaceae bacterium]